MIRKRIEKLKDMHLTTDLGEGAEIVAPSDEEWKPVAERLRDLIRTHAGHDLPIVAGGEVSLSELKERHWVILGSAMNNPALMALYRRKYAFVDDFYPGGDGYAIRTIHNPENRGHNVLLVGASRPEGAAAGLEKLSEVLKEKGDRFGYTNVARSATHEALLPDITPEEFRKQTEPAFRGNVGRGPIKQGVTLGLVHYFTHDADCARMFRDVLFYYEDLVKDRYGGEWCFEHMLFIYAWVWRLFYIWDLIEESDAFTDAERLRMTNLLWGLTNYVADLSYFRGEEPPPSEIRQNHLTFAGLSMSFSAGFFKTYYGIEDFEKQLRFCQAIFDGQAGCYKPNDDGGGGGYCWLVPNHQMIYDLNRDNFRFLEGGQLRDIADYAILITDNLGSSVGFGDVGYYGARRKPSPGMTSTLCKAAWYYGDGAYLWTLNWMRGTPQHDCFYRSIPANVPEQMTGIAIAPFNQPLYEWVQQHGPGGANVPLEEAFDKLTLRGGFDEDDEYLLIDGTSTFAHGHEDGNSIERLTWKGRMWLAEMDYIWKRPRHHSSVVSICDGESLEMPSLVALKWAEDFGDVAFTRTCVPGYNGTDWTRDILWVKGKYLLVTDSLKLLRDADYDLRCLWRTLGNVRLEGKDLTVEQKGVSFGIRNADDSDKSLEIEESRIAGQDPYEGYDYANGPIRIFKQRKAFHGRSGEVERYFNLLVAGTEAEVDSLRIGRIGEGIMRIEGPDGPAIFGVADKGIRIGEFQATADAFMLTNSSLLLLNGTRLSLGGASFESELPIHLVLYPAEGRGEVRAKQEARVTAHNALSICFDGEHLPSSGGVTLPPGIHAVELEPGPHQILINALRSETPYTHRRTPKNKRSIGCKGSILRSLWEKPTRSNVRCIDVLGEAIAVGTVAGQVALLDREGHVQWARETGAEVRTVHLADFGDGMSLLTGGRDCALTRFDAAGNIKWKRDFIKSHRRNQIVNAVKTSDLEGDGRTEIVVATDGWLVWALTPGGEEIWQRQIEHHAAQSLVIGDVEGDGKREILVGTEYHTSNLLEADGRVRWTIHGGPCFTALALEDLNGDGVRESIYGAMDGNVYAVDSVSGKILWKANLGDDVRHGFAVNADGRVGFVAGSESGNVVLLSSDRRKLWRRDLDAPVIGLAFLQGVKDGEDAIAAGTSEGWITLLSLDGKIIGSYQADTGLTTLTRLTFPDGPGLLAATNSGLLIALVLT